MAPLVFKWRRLAVCDLYELSKIAKAGKQNNYSVFTSSGWIII